MTRRLTKDELDEQFELFLKESVSDDSVDLGVLEKSTSAKDKSQKPTQKVSWWEEDDDKEKPKPRFLKAPKRQTDEADDRVTSGRRLLKSLPKSQTIREEDESMEQKRPEHVLKEENGAALSSLVETDSLREGVLMGAESVPMGAESVPMGSDTLDEEREKKRFFAELEAEASSTIDYSKLNRDLDSSASTERPEKPEQRKTEQVLEEADKESHRESPGSPRYSDDFEEDTEVKEPEQEQKPKMSPILAKVSFYDSLDDTRDDERQKLTTVSLDKAQSGAQSGGSDLEALREALQIHMVQDSEELQGTFSSSLKPEPRRSPSPPPAPLHRPASTTESDLPTAEELMKPIRPEEEDLRGFSLQPLRVLDPPDSAGTVSGFLQRKPGAVDGSEKLLSGWTFSTDLLLDPEPPQIQDRTWSIPEELQRLLQEDEAPAPSNRTKKQSSGVSGSHLRRPTATAVQGRRLDSRTTVTSRPGPGPGLGPGPGPKQGPKPGPGSVQSKSKTFRASAPQPRVSRSTKGPEKTQSASERAAEGGDLVTSVQSLVSVLQQQINLKLSDSAPNVSPTTVLTEERSEVEALKVLLLEKEQLIEKLKNDSQELNSVQQQNFILQSQLRSAEEALQKKRTDGTDSTPEKLQLEKDLKELETLIKGYQQV